MVRFPDEALRDFRSLSLTTMMSAGSCSGQSPFPRLADCCMQIAFGILHVFCKCYVFCKVCVGLARMHDGAAD